MTLPEFEKFRAEYIAASIRWQKELLTLARDEAKVKDGPDSGPSDCGVDPSDKTEI